jgi:hypothetical protein
MIGELAWNAVKNTTSDRCRSETSLLHYFWRPIPLLLYPAMLWCALCYGISLGWVVLQLTANATYLPPLYNFSALAVGNTNIAVSQHHPLFMHVIN